MRLRPTLAALLTLAAAGIALGQAEKDVPGRKHLIRPDDLPRPYHTNSVNNGPALVPRPQGMLPQVPRGFTVNVFAENLGGENSPRLMAVAPNGDVFTTLSGNHQVVVLRDADNDGAAEVRDTFAGRENGLELPFGLAFHGDWLYVANTNEVVRFRYRSGQTRAEGRGESVIQGIPGRGYNQHWTRDILFSPDGRKLYLTVGSETNVSEEGPMRAAIHEYNPDGSGYRRYAWGIRNPVGLAFHPMTKQLWCTCNERDELGDDLVPDYFTAVKDGGFYGWPWFYIGRNQDPRHAGKRPDLTDQIIVPDVLIQSHSAALGCVFYTGSQFPQEYRNDAFIAFHGSWNRTLRTGYKVVRVRFQNGRPAGGYEDFMTGFLVDARLRNVWGRPVGVAVARDGSLLVTDDGGHRIWRVAYGGR
jgi:glucose/arabinose dehydrogenase